MTNIKTYIKTISAMIISCLEYLVRGFDNSIKTLLSFTIADVFTVHEKRT